ncbi:hypothetical protein [Leptolyngbya ohadii]|uniref:hypothetical protein n=1 Tax=Leptolyngbya ohadii TaxID=1962290 RepID=UPI000B59BB5B|nr:hypothetical protein [Leptolyngbya ohadii]
MPTKKQRRLERKQQSAQRRKQKQVRGFKESVQPAHIQRNIPTKSSSSSSQSSILSVFSSLEPQLIESLQINQVEFDRYFLAFIEDICEEVFADDLIPESPLHRRQVEASLLRNKEAQELAAFAIAQNKKIEEAQTSSVTNLVSLVDVNPNCFFWEGFWWNKPWNDSTCSQGSFGDPVCCQYATLDMVIQKMIDQKLLLPAEREEIKAECLASGEYWCGDEKTAGWSITKAECQPMRSDPNSPLWLLIDWGEDWHVQSYTESDKCHAAILEPFRVDWLEWHGKVCLRHKTLTEIFSHVFPDKSWADLDYQEAWIQRIAADGLDSYIYLSSNNRRLQISREQSLEEAKDEDLYLI